MINIEISSDRISDFWFKVKSWPVKLDQAVSAGVRESIDDVRDYIKYVLLEGEVLNKRTGTLQASIKSDQPEPHIGVVFSDGSAPYWAIHEFGSREGWFIRAVNAKTLHFVIEGRDCFPKVVFHPPMKQRSYLARGLRDQRQHIRDVITRNIQEALA